MKRFRDRRHVPYAAAEMFRLVSDVESYPKFVPLCEGMRVRRRTPLEHGIEIIVAEMQVGFKAICERYTSRVTCDSPKLEVRVEYIDGPFKRLESRWTFRDEEPNASGSKRSCVDFSIAYEFKSAALGLLMGAVFDKAFHKYADAFVERAGKVYGRAAGSLRSLS
ncbi:type II toxin-antitoxin system RatA family toxin [Methylocystis bryophila]|uniref:Ubiquinone-binding protein n=1 Tax=Methylocystis bryophila TaxID=655015 RepID=A0A1W6MZB6_9HYPH|nr:type II toxin-antitoxin system RatA family toxin [Methylocystis bryophila]ARN82925.1 ubiquinone-binding protein [Methylocystis bryophila]